MTHSSAPLLELNGIRKEYQMGGETIVALDEVHLQVARGESVAFIGASGAGKSTLLNILGCLDRPTAGTYHLNGQDVASLDENGLARLRNREIGFIFQNFQLLPRASALDNVAHPLLYRAMKPAQRRERARHALQRVGLADRASHLPSQLSGGQRQRVAIARALCGEPSILLADEPTGNLDSRTGEAILALFHELLLDGHTLLVVTHESAVAERCGRVLSVADGRLAQQPPAQRPAHAHAA
ncbi:ABC transporter ATP-binding protein [Stenotrophomonas sp. JAI102]|uniref:ABC transporter ATP-binding protein n=1 Tax=Stenotrophomonas sp. JAI102 TaxID=2723077 RepID=UPI0017F5B4D6|nr:ABC transporter ATP-binding protein [Stenotrophomonas sp. JAI102]NYF35939.1 putative ABC transport system ATP-binding protein [Stenotrophomonas sp. JAI102]